MYPTSLEFKNAVRRSHQAVVRAEIWRGDSKLLELTPISGSVDVDARRSVRRTASVLLAAPRPTTVEVPTAPQYEDLAADYATYGELATNSTAYGPLGFTGDTTTVEVDTNLVPVDGFDVLAPFGNELRLWRGVRVTQETNTTYAALAEKSYAEVLTDYASYGIILIADTEVVVDELVPIFTGPITDVEITDGDSGVQVAVSASDRSLIVSRARWVETYKVDSGTNVVDAITELLEDRYDDVQTRFIPQATTVNKSILGTSAENDPWKDAQDIAAAGGLTLYFDGEGVAVLAASEDYENATPDAFYAENDEAMVLTLTRRLTNEQTYNAVVATAEGSETADTYRALVTDDDPSSPTYYGGPFGKVPRFFSSSLMTTQAAVEAAAASLLAKYKGVPESVEWTQIVDPSLDADDVIALTNTGAKVDRYMVIDRLTIPLDPSESMSATARTVRVLNGQVVGETVGN